MLLPFQAQVVEGLLRSDSCLCVLGRGLGLQAVLLELARRPLRDGGVDPKHATRLVLLIHSSQDEAELLLRRAREDAAWTGLLDRLVVVGPELGVEDRAEAYAKGGVFVVSARLLVPDLLSGRLVPEAVDGILVNHAHSVGEFSAEAFVLRIFRRGNRRGFVWALSDRPDCFQSGQAQVEKVMQRCFTQHLEVWPRIREEVQKCLQGGAQPEVCQKTLALSLKEEELQRVLLNIIDGTLDELRKDPNLSLGHLSVQGSLFQSFEAELRQEVDPVWKSLGPRTRRLVHDLTGVHQLLSALPRCDAVEFHRLVDGMWAPDGDRELPAWLLGPDAQRLLSLSKARMYELVGGGGGAAGAAAGGGAPPLQLRRALEPHAKWQVLLDILASTVEQVAAAEATTMVASVAIPPTVATSPAAGRCKAEAAQPQRRSLDDSDSDLEIVAVISPKRPRRLSFPEQAPDPPSAGVDPCVPASDVLQPRVLVVVPDDRIRRQVLSVLEHGPEATLLDALAAHLREASSPGLRPQRAPRAAEAALLSREAAAAARERDALPPSAVLQARLLQDGRPCQLRVEVVASDGPHGMLEAHLHALRPHAVVLFEPCLDGIRALEVFCAGEHAASAAACGPAIKVEASDGPAVVPAAPPAPEPSWRRRQPPPLRAYLLVFEDSVEKYRFQQEIVQESKAVDALIRARQHHTVRVDEIPLTPAEAAANSSTRRGGGPRSLLAGMVQQKVVVDMREFRSALPFMLYLRQLVVEPVTIPVGDYVLSRDICVERKAVPDLIQSLASGRLYQQAQNMCRYYANPSLLIEFDPGKSFALQNTWTIAKREVDVGARDLLGKLSLLVIHFPKLRVIWSPSPAFTADIFLKLKEGRYQPDPQAAAAAGLAEASEPDMGGAGSGPHQQQAGRPPAANSAALDVLRKLPGVTPRNMYALARRAGSLAGLAGLEKEELEGILGKAGAQLLHDFLHRDVSEGGAASPDRAGVVEVEVPHGPPG